MASWIIHLRIAENLLDTIPGLDVERFALGSVAPDSGKPDEKWENFTPPTCITHFQAADTLGHDCADLDFFRQYLLPIRATSEPQVLSFRLGYFFHLITDNRWGIQIGWPTYQNHKERADADKDFFWEVKKDWYGLDFLYVWDHPDCLFWKVFCTAKPYAGGLDFLAADSLAWSVDHIQKYYQRTDAEVTAARSHAYIYLTAAEADRFVAESSRELFRIYQQVWLNGSIPDGRSSVLN